MARTPARNANAPQDQQPPGKKGSPKKAGKDRLQIKVTSTKQARRIAYLFKILKLAADIEVIWCEKSPRDDAFLYPLVKNIEGANQFGDEGVIAVTHRRISRTDNSVLFNANDSYPRRLIVRTIDESTPESRRAILMLFRDFMMRPENNRFGYEYVVDNTSDVTPLSDDMLEPVNAYIPDSSIVNVILAVYENDDKTWYSRNLDIAADYFGDMPYPRYAIDMLGYPDSNAVGTGAFAPGFNPSNAN